MKKVVADFWRSHETWSIIGLLFAALISIIAGIMMVQRRDYQHSTDASLARAIEEIRHEVQSLRAADEKSVADRQQIKKEVREVKEAVEQ